MMTTTGIAPLRIILGSARSGTTWLQDVLAQANRLRTIFEPLNPNANRGAADFAYRYIRRGDDPSGLEQFLAAQCYGKAIHLWSDLRVNPRHVFRWQPPMGYAAQALYMTRGLKRRVHERGCPPLVKLIRANLMSGWLTARANARIVLMIRHPCGVVASQLRLDPNAWHDHRELLLRYLDDENLVADFLTEIRSDLLNLRDPIRVRAALWCVENSIPVKTAAADGLPVIFYENLIVGEPDSWNRVLDALDLEELPSEEALGAPSQQASVDVKRRSAQASNVDRWRQRLGEEGIHAVQEILDLFGVEFYSTTEPFPSSLFEAGSVVGSDQAIQQGDSRGE